MKNIFVATVVLCMGMMLFISMKGDKETLADIIAKQEKILVAVDRYYSKIVRYPIVGSSSENKEQIPAGMRDKFMESIVESLNKGFNTEVFQYYKGELVDQKMMCEKGLQFFVIVAMKGKYSMNAEPESDNRYIYKFMMDITQYFYQVNEKGKPKQVSNKPSGITANCEASSFSKNLPLKHMIAQLRPQCLEQELLKKIEKRNKKFTEKELAKAAK